MGFKVSAELFARMQTVYGDEAAKVKKDFESSSYLTEESVTVLVSNEAKRKEATAKSAAEAAKSEILEWLNESPTPDAIGHISHPTFAYDSEAGAWVFAGRKGRGGGGGTKAPRTVIDPSWIGREVTFCKGSRKGTVATFEGLTAKAVITDAGVRVTSVRLNGKAVALKSIEWNNLKGKMSPFAGGKPEGSFSKVARALWTLWLRRDGGTAHKQAVNGKACFVATGTTVTVLDGPAPATPKAPKAAKPASKRKTAKSAKATAKPKK